MRLSDGKLGEGQAMAYDLLIKNGGVIDGSGIPAFRGDVAVSHSRIVATGKLRDSATRTIDADGLAVAPGFIDSYICKTRTVAYSSNPSVTRKAARARKLGSRF
jgi:N-acyl-D-aspartate/D-glutamate deacylase